MNTKPNKLPVALGWFNIVLGLLFFFAYWAYLPMPEKFTVAGHPDPGMILYSLATAGGAFVAWGMLLRSGGAGISRSQLFKASAIGFALLGLMRLGTAIFPHPPFDQMVALPAIECATFLVVAFSLFKSA